MPELGLYRGMACAKAVGLTPDLTTLTPGQIIRRNSGRYIVDITPRMIGWLQDIDMNIVLSPIECWRAA